MPEARIIQLGAPGREEPIEALSPAELGRRMGRLASLTASYKMARGEGFVEEPYRTRIIRAAGLASDWDAHPWTDRIMAASSDQLGKGGIVGTISNAVTHVTQAVTAPIKKIAAPIENIVSSIPVVGGSLSTVIKTATGGESLKSLAQETAVNAQQISPLLSKLPVIGPAVAAAASVGGNLLGQLTGAGKMLTTNPVGAVGELAGDVVGDLGSVVDGVFHGVASFPGQAYTGISGLISAGKRVFDNFGSSAWSAIERASPNLSGELTSIFHGLGSAYQSHSFSFDKWSTMLKGAGPGTWVGKVGESLYTIAKDELGHFTVHQTPVAQSSPSISNLVADGNIVSADQTVQAKPVSPVGADWGPWSTPPAPWNGQGQPSIPVGASLPPGPNSGAGSMATDETTQALIAAALAKNQAPAPAVKEASAASPLMIAALVGLGAMVLFGGRGNGPLVRRRR